MKEKFTEDLTIDQAKIALGSYKVETFCPNCGYTKFMELPKRSSVTSVQEECPKCEAGVIMSVHAKGVLSRGMF